MPRSLSSSARTFLAPLMLSAAALSLSACAATTDAKSTMSESEFDAAKLDTILAAQDEDARARYQYRRPAETLEFFGLTPGMKVAEALPGGGWYSKILIPYLGPDGSLLGIDYTPEMWSEFSFATPEFVATKVTFPETWPAQTREWVPTGGADVSAINFAGANAPVGELDAVLFIRALHNFNRFEAEGGYMTEALALANSMLKPGGIVGVVQHRAPETAPANWADGSKGYLKQSEVIAKFEAAGFDLVEASEINANPKDQPGADDIVWRLHPSLNGVGDDADLRAERVAIGESDRMTLKFRKR